jgi:preprotein translocase subunit Sec61beta
MGACTFEITGHDVHGRSRLVKGNLTFSDSYATGGDSLDPKVAVGVGQVTDVLVAQNDQGASVKLGAASTVVAPVFELYTGDGTEAANASDNSGIAIPVWLFCSS